MFKCQCHEVVRVEMLNGVMAGVSFHCWRTMERNSLSARSFVGGQMRLC